MHNKSENILRPVDIIVTTGVSVIIVIPEITLYDKRCFTLFFKLTRPQIEKLRLAKGTEKVRIQNGVSGSAFPLEDCAGDAFYANSLLPCYKYRIRFGNDGVVDTTGTSGLSHYINLNTPCCKRQINLANGVVAETETGTEG